ncbi:MAG: hypothetical protein K2X39_09840 [Silvanigrellaceae bacterium]|nr:hypothetical protein [Silvanigrellaceae bacterium]
MLKNEEYERGKIIITIKFGRSLLKRSDYDLLIGDLKSYIKIYDKNWQSQEIPSNNYVFDEKHVNLYIIYNLYNTIFLYIDGNHVDCEYLFIQINNWSTEFKGILNDTRLKFSLERTLINLDCSKTWKDKIFGRGYNFIQKGNTFNTRT